MRRGYWVCEWYIRRFSHSHYYYYYCCKVAIDKYNNSFTRSITFTAHWVEITIWGPLQYSPQVRHKIVFIINTSFKSAIACAMKLMMMVAWVLLKNFLMECNWNILLQKELLIGNYYLSEILSCARTDYCSCKLVFKKK